MYPEAVMRARGPLLALLGAVLAVWAVVAARPSPLPPQAPAPLPAAALPMVRDIAGLERASIRLADGRRQIKASLPAPSRNPFEFVVAKPKPVIDQRAKATAALTALAPMVLPPALPQVALVGLVDREVDGRVVRTAVLSFGGRLHYVEAGGRVGGAYEVVAVGPNAVDLLALDSNTPRRLVQR